MTGLRRPPRRSLREAGAPLGWFIERLFQDRFALLRLRAGQILRAFRWTGRRSRRGRFAWQRQRLVDGMGVMRSGYCGVLGWLGNGLGWKTAGLIRFSGYGQTIGQSERPLRR